jgi:GDP-D-mannose dehydratase
MRSVGGETFVTRKITRAVASIDLVDRDPMGIKLCVRVGRREAYGMHASNGILFNHESPIQCE